MVSKPSEQLEHERELAHDSASYWARRAARQEDRADRLATVLREGVSLMRNMVALLRVNSNREYSDTQEAVEWCSRVGGMGERNEKENPSEDRKWWVWLDPSLGSVSIPVVRGYFEDHVAELLNIDRERLVAGRDGSVFVVWIEKVTGAEIQRAKKLLGPLIHPKIVWEVRQGESPVWTTDGNPLKEVWEKVKDLEDEERS